MTIKQVMHFLENDDATTIHYRRFNLSPKDKYPTYSICFTGSELYWYQAKSLFDVFGVSPSKFEEMLKGQKGIRYDYDYASMLYNKTIVDLRNFADVDIDKFSLKMSDILTGLKFVTDDDMASIRHGVGTPREEIDKMFDGVSYKTPDAICFTRASRDSVNTQRLYDWLAFSPSVLERPEFQDVRLKIVVHYPQQLMRSFHNPAFQSTVRIWNKKYYNDVKIAISKVTILRKRPGSNVPCDDNLENDDEKLQQQIMNRIECTPPYWKRWDGMNSSLKVCKSDTKLRRAYSLILDYKNILKSYYSPCIQMEILSKFDRRQSKKGEEPRITFLYEEADYEEVTNTRSFDFASFVSGVGGFIGIFLGYSILQIPELVESLPTLMINLRQNIREGKLGIFEMVIGSHDIMI